MLNCDDRSTLIGRSINIKRHLSDLDCRFKSGAYKGNENAYYEMAGLLRFRLGSVENELGDLTTLRENHAIQAQ
jgi:hypothetical protein